MFYSAELRGLNGGFTQSGAAKKQAGEVVDCFEEQPVNDGHGRAASKGFAIKSVKVRPPR